MLGIQRIRELLPQQCEGKSDEQIARAYHRQYYPQMDFDEFQRRFYAADAQGRRGRSGRSQANGQGASRGPDQMRQAMDRAGLGYDKESGNYYPYLRDEKGKLVLDEKGARMLDYDRGAASSEYIAETMGKLSGKGLQRPQQAAQPGQQAVQQPQDMPEAAAIAEAEAYRVPEVGEIMAGIPGISGQKSAALRQGMQMQRNAPVIDADFQDAIADLDNYGSDLKQGVQGAISRKLWGDVSPEDSGVMSERARQAEERLAQVRERNRKREEAVQYLRDQASYLDR